MIKRIKLKKLFLAIVILEIVLMIVIVFLLQVNIRLEKRLSIAENQRFAMNMAADRLRQSSDDLTRFARTYVITGDKKYKQNYYKIIDIRNGTARRPQQYESIYWDYLEPLRSQLHPDGEAISLEAIMKALPYTEAEREKLRISHQNSDELVNLEVEAFNAMEGYFKDDNGEYTIKGEPDQKMAIELLHSRTYHLAKQKIMQPIDEFLLMLNQRTLNLVNKLQKKIVLSSTIFEIIIGLFIIINLFTFAVLHNRIIKVVTYITEEIKNFKGKSLYLKHFNREHEDELGTLICEFNSMQSLIEEKTEMLEQKNEKLFEQHKVIDKYIIISETDLNGNITYASEAFCKISGYKKEELCGKNHRIIRHPDMPKEIFDELWRKISIGEKWHGQLKNRKKGGGFYWVDAIIEPKQNKDNIKVGYRSLRLDITDKKRIEELSIIDRLTGLYNRSKLDEVFEYEINQADRYNKNFSVIMIDIDFFKEVNDKNGHQVGDLVLQKFAKILLKNVRVTDSVGRLGGEEFLILCPGTTLKNSAKLAEKLRQKVENFNFPIVGMKTASFGVTTYHRKDNKDEVLGRVDKALYKAKKSGRNQVVVL